MNKKSKLYRKDIRDAITIALSKGVSIDAACEFSGVHHSTYYNQQNWLNQKLGNNWQDYLYDHEDYKDENLDENVIEALEFFESIKKALAVCKVELVAKIRNSDAWQSSAWLLERRWPEEFGRQRLEPSEKKFELNVENAHTIVADILELFSAIPTERLKEIGDRPTAIHKKPNE